MMADIVPLQSWRARVQEGDRGPKKNVTNLMLFLRHLPELGPKLRFNQLAYRVEWDGEPLAEHHLLDIRLILENNRFEPRVQDLLPAIQRYAMENSYHPVQEYLSGLKWDGRKRLDHWMHKLLGADDTPFVRAVGRRTLIAAVARAFKPGCKVDTVLILEGPQGLKKSTAIAELFGPDLTAESVSLFDQHNKMVMQMMGAWVVELAEFVAFFNKDQNTVKGLISMREDKVVLPYAKMSSTHPRQCIFFGTVNPGEVGYLTDTTGNRRYWPVSVTAIDIDTIREHRDQIWAEACDAYHAGERWWLDDGEAAFAEEQTASRVEHDPWEEVLMDKLIGIDRITPTEAMRHIGIPSERMDRRGQMRVATALKRMGFTRTVTKDANRKSLIEWRRA